MTTIKSKNHAKKVLAAKGFAGFEIEKIEGVYYLHGYSERLKVHSSEFSTTCLNACRLDQLTEKSLVREVEDIVDEWLQY